MIETETLIQWTRELCAFVNPYEPHPLFTAEDVTPWPAEDRLPEETRTPEQVATLRATTKKALIELARWKPSQPAPKRLVRLAEDWLDDDLVRSTNPNYNLTPMDGVLSLTADGRLQVDPRFRSLDAQYAVTFAELIQQDAPAMIKRCNWCKAFFVIVKVGRGRGAPRELCDPHYEELVRTKKKPEWAKPKARKRK